MNYTHLGRTGLKVSRLCLGTMNFGDVTDEKTSARILDEALEAGINFIDTADVYGTEQSPDIQQGSGLSEEIIGRWLQQGGRRERIVLATKVYQPMGPGPNDRRLSAYHIRKACEDSLRRLKTDHIDVYQMHHIDRHTPWEEIWQAMELLVQQGKVLYIGSSNFAGWDIATAQSVATARHFLGLVAEQSLYNLTARTFESSDRCGETVARTCLFGQRRISQFSYYNMSAYNVYYVKCNVVLNNVIFDSCLFPHQHYDRHSFHARECCAIRQNVRGDKSSMAFNNHFAHYSLFSFSKSQGNSFSHTCCLYCPAYLTAVAFSDRTRHGMPDEMLI